MRIKLSRKEFLTIYKALAYKDNCLRLNLSKKPTDKGVREINFITSLQNKLMLRKINNYRRFYNED